MNVVISKLQTSNVWACFAHVVSFGALVGLYQLYQNSHKHAVAVTYRYALPTVDALNSTCNTTNEIVTVPAGQCQTDPLYGLPKKTPFEFNIIFGCLAFFAITAGFHYFYASDGFGYGSYTKVIKAGWNPYRWVEYGISASLMSLLIGWSLGVRDASQLLSLVVLTAGMQSCGYVVEATLKDGPSFNKEVVKGATTGGWLLFAALWIPLLYNFWAIDNDVNLNYKNEIDPATGKKIKIPAWVWLIVISQLFNFAFFGIIQALQVRAAFKGMPKPFPKVEKQYILLSYAGKLALAGSLAYGLVYRTRNCE